MRTAPHIRLCGSLRVEAGGAGEATFEGRQTAAMFAYMTLNRERPIGRDELTRVLWEDRRPVDPDASLRTALSRLRAVVGPLLAGGRALTLDLPDGTFIDLAWAREQVAESAACARRGDWSRARDLARGALEVLDRGLLVGLEGEWLELHRRAALDLVEEALEHEAGGHLRARRPDLDAALRGARRLVAVAPYRESAHRLLLEIQMARGDLAEALFAYETLRQRLRDDLGTVPGAQVRRMHEDLLRATA